MNFALNIKRLNDVLNGAQTHLAELVGRGSGGCKLSVGLLSVLHLPRPRPLSLPRHVFFLNAPKTVHSHVGKNIGNILFHSRCRIYEYVTLLFLSALSLFLGFCGRRHHQHRRRRLKQITYQSK